MTTQVLKHTVLILQSGIKAGCRIWIAPNAEKDYQKCNNACTEDNWCRLFNSSIDGKTLDSSQKQNLGARIKECQDFWCKPLYPY